MLNGISHVKEGKIPCSVNVIIPEKLKENICQLVMLGNIWILITFFPLANLAKLNGRRKSSIKQLGKFKDHFSFATNTTGNNDTVYLRGKRCFLVTF